MKYSLFNNHLQEAIASFLRDKKKILRWLRNQDLIQRRRKIQNTAILYHAALAKIVDGRSYEDLAKYMAARHNIQMCPSAWQKWLDKVAPKLLEYAQTQVRKALKDAPDSKEFAIDATRLTMEGTGEVVRIHTVMQLETALPAQTEATDQHGAESAARAQVQEGCLYLCDRAYGRATSIAHFAENKADYICRISPSQFCVYSDKECGNKVQLSEYLKEENLDMVCWCRVKKKGGQKVYKVRLVGKRLPEEEQAETEARVRRNSSRRGNEIQPQTILYSKWVLLVTSLMDTAAEKILEKYKERWQIELLFKRGKSVLKFRKLRSCGEKYRTTEVTLWLFVIKLFSVAIFRSLQTISGEYSLYKLFNLAKDCFC